MIRAAAGVIRVRFPGPARAKAFLHLDRPHSYERRSDGAFSMAEDWFTYAEAAERLNTTPEAVRQKAIRGRWQRTIGNDKRALVRLPDGWPNPVRTPSVRPRAPAVRTPSERASDSQLIKALESHVETLKQQLGAAEARLAAADARDAQHAADLAAERAQTEKAIAAFSAVEALLDTLAAERARPWWRRLTG
jgi:hypothetical protein